YISFILIFHKFGINFSPLIDITFVITVELTIEFTSIEFGVEQGTIVRQILKGITRQSKADDKIL
ncbi:hypothetical protein RYX36_008088, partial [Vicia faba]